MTLRMKEPGIKVAECEAASRRIAEDMWINFHWQANNPLIHPDVRMSTLPSCVPVGLWMPVCGLDA